MTDYFLKTLKSFIIKNILVLHLNLNYSQYDD